MDSTNSNQSGPDGPDDHHQLIHKIALVTIYVAATAISMRVLSLSEAQKDLVTLISTGAILATFGSALSSLGSVWEGDLLERVNLNIDIFYRDIIRQEAPWRRWPFLPRTEKKRLLDGTRHHVKLSNPEVPLDVGSHIVKVDLPTVLKDFFDLPVTRNWWQLIKYRKSAHTLFGRNAKGDKSPTTGMSPSDELMAYECMLDIWESVFRFRAARYTTHFGAALTLSGAIVTATHVAARAV